MLSQVYLSQNLTTHRKMDVHKHATFSCMLSKLFRKVGSLLNAKR
jgi:hypothetical protein